ncbi:MAG TPA: hypothetical protein VL793_09515, partial [Patescibacteria group bacterium]|nr:hypothetical protein [Patescibacteria group bacterium]
PWLKNAQINRDRDLRLQYLAGLGLNANESEAIYEQLCTYRKFPEDIFVGSNTWNESLKRSLDQRSSNKASAAEPRSNRVSQPRTGR